MEYECAVVSLYYLQRVLVYSNGSFFYTSSNWRAVVLAAMLLANKLWDDFHMSNYDYTYIFPGITLERINELEVALWLAMGHNLIVSRSNYSQTHFAVQEIIAKDDIAKHKREGNTPHVCVPGPILIPGKEGNSKKSPTDTNVYEESSAAVDASTTNQCFGPDALAAAILLREHEGPMDHHTEKESVSSWDVAGWDHVLGETSDTCACVTYVDGRPRKRNMLQPIQGATTIGASCGCFSFLYRSADEDDI